MKNSMIYQIYRKLPVLMLICCLGILTSCNTEQNTPKQENVEEIILSLERQALDNWAKGDPVGFSKNFADDATYFDDIGAQLRLDGNKEVHEYFLTLNGQIPAHKYEIVDPKVQMHGDIAILTLRYYATSLDNEPGPPWKATSVYKLTEGKWQVVHANWSLLKEQ